LNFYIQSTNDVLNFVYIAAR